MSKGRFSKQQFIGAISGSGGIIVTIADRVGCDWHTAKKYIEKYSDIGQAYLDECEKINDLAVGTVLRSIKEGDVSTAKWWLTKKRKGDYGEALDITTNGQPITVNWDDSENNE